jgi:hypothetical protein
MRASFQIAIPFLAAIVFSGCRDAQQNAAASLTENGIATQLNVAGKVSRVDATSASLPDDFWSTLAEFPELNALVLTSVELSERDLASLDSFEKLESLDASYTNVSSVGIGHLTRVASLRDLALNGVELDEKCLQSLAGMRQLRSLALVQTNLNDEQITQLQSALPGCLIAR